MEQATKMTTNKSENITSGISKKTGCFTTTDVLRSLNIDFLDETYCREWILKQLHGDNPACPGCGYHNEIPKNYWDGKLVRCKLCDKWFTGVTDTFLSAAKLNFREVFLLAVLLGLGQDNQAIANILRVTPETIRRWRRKFDEIGANRP